ncbi:hypothetical protein C8Q74DRAFT_1374121 [Fomes fomentarius]|nr:hypothetical protein C8Q74DRAFT_1374121 [Fomes fomentarius]
MSAPSTCFLQASIVPATAAAWTFIYLKQLYRPVICFGWSFVVVGVALLAKAKTGESPDHVIGVSALIGVGLGHLSPLHPRALVFLVYLRTLSGVWGIAIATAVLQNKIAPRIPSDVWNTEWYKIPAWAYAYSAHVWPTADYEFLLQVAQQHAQVQAAYRDSLELVWAAIGAIAALGFVSSLLMKAVPLQEHTQGGWMMMQSGINKEDTEELVERRQKGQEA